MTRCRLGLFLFAAVAVSLASSEPAGAMANTASCVGFGSSVTGALHLRADIATNPETFPPGADTSRHAQTHGNTFEACFSE